MLVGHVGAALALRRAERRVNLGVLILAALLLDVLLWLFVLAGLEQVIVPPTTRAVTTSRSSSPIPIALPQASSGLSWPVC